MEVVEESLDTFFLIVGAALVFFMQVGFAMIAVGSINVMNLAMATDFILLKNMLDISLGALAWWFVGYGLVYGKSGGFGGTSKFGLAKEDFEDQPVNGSSHGSGYAYATFLFSYAYAVTSTAIVSGAMAERCTQTAYIIASITMTSLTYPMVASWAWNDSGWANPNRDNDAPLFDCGVLDFGGSGVVHVTSGMAAFLGVYIIGPRRAFVSETLILPMYGSTFKSIGTMILWLGWFGFNGMGTMAIVGKSQIVARAMVNTAIAGASGSVANGLLGGYLEGRQYGHRLQGFTLDGANRGVIGGLVSISAGCALVDPFAACVTGLLSAPLNTAVSRLLTRNAIDDVVDATAQHLACGLLGLLSASLFATRAHHAEVYGERGNANEKCAGAFYGGDGRAVAAAVVFALAVMAWVCLTCGLLFKVLAKLYVLRVSIATEEVGLDDSAHNNHTLSKVECGDFALDMSLSQRSHSSHHGDNSSGSMALQIPPYKNFTFTHRDSRSNSESDSNDCSVSPRTPAFSGSPRTPAFSGIGRVGNGGNGGSGSRSDSISGSKYDGKASSLEPIVTPELRGELGMELKRVMSNEDKMNTMDSSYSKGRRRSSHPSSNSEGTSGTACTFSIGSSAIASNASSSKSETQRDTSDCISPLSGPPSSAASFSSSSSIMQLPPLPLSLPPSPQREQSGGEVSNSSSSGGGGGGGGAAVEGSSRLATIVSADDMPGSPVRSNGGAGDTSMVP